MYGVENTKTGFIITCLCWNPFTCVSIPSESINLTFTSLILITNPYPNVLLFLLYHVCQVLYIVFVSIGTLIFSIIHTKKPYNYL